MSKLFSAEFLLYEEKYQCNVYGQRCIQAGMNKMIRKMGHRFRRIFLSSPFFSDCFFWKPPFMSTGFRYIIFATMETLFHFLYKKKKTKEEKAAMTINAAVAGSEKGGKKDE